MKNPNNHYRRNSDIAIWFLAFCYLIFVVYGSLVPLRFAPIPLDQAIAKFSQIPFLNIGIESRADWVANFLLFIPLSTLWCQIILSKPRFFHPQTNRLLLLITLTALACAIEFAQIYFPQRTVSQNDIIAETIGGIFGLVVQALWGNRLQNAIQSLWDKENQATRLNRILHSYLFGLLLFNILPLDLTFSPVEIYHKWRTGKVIIFPFSGLKGDLHENIYETLTDIIIWIPPGIFWLIDKRQSIAQIFFYGLLAGFAIEVAQVFVYSRVSDVTDIFLASFGTLIGAVFAIASKNIGQNAPKIKPSFFWLSLWIIWQICVFCVFWFPFNFSTNRPTFSESFGSITHIPFITYYYGTEFHAINEFLRKIGMFLPSGVLMALGISAVKNETVRFRIKAVGILLIFVAAFSIEIGQVFLPNKTADITDVFIEFLGGLIGLFATKWVISGYNNKLNKGKHFPTPATNKPPQNKTTAHWKSHALNLLFIFALITIITKNSITPYNIRELIPSGTEGVISVLGLGLAIYWFANGHFVFIQWSNGARMLLLPLWVLTHGIISWILIRGSIPLESIHDIVGSPVLDWPWEWEILGRFLCLHGAISLQTIGACLLALIASKREKIETFIIWIFWCALLSWPAHVIVIENAATDNLTELMRDSGTFPSSTILSLGFLGLFIAGSFLSHAFAVRNNLKSSFVVALLSSIASISCFWLGSEEILIKYGKTFSAWQFLFSTDRDNYLTGANLFFRFGLVYSIILAIFSLSQATAFRQFKTKIYYKPKRRNENHIKDSSIQEQKQ